jgi:outer membrane biosynthesis protein TonB
MNTNSTTNDRRKSLLLSILLFATMLIMLFFIRFWPPSDVAELAGGGGGGVTVNFGDSELGMGETFDNKTNITKEELQSESAPKNQDENIISEENSKDDGIIIPKKETVIKPKVVLQKPEKVVIAQKPKLNETANSALANIIKGAKKGGDGNTKTPGNQGSANGSLSNGDYGIGGKGKGTGGGDGNGNGKGSGDGSGNGSGGGAGNGKGTGSGYSLNGRKAMSKPKPDSSCSNETGVVVVEVTVDKNGTTIHAVVGKRGSTITAKCLKDQAKQAAINTKWAPSPEGTEEQVGEIIYTFGLN